MNFAVNNSGSEGGSLGSQGKSYAANEGERRGPNALVIILVVIVVAAVGVGTYLYFQGSGSSTDDVAMSEPMQSQATLNTDEDSVSLSSAIGNESATDFANSLEVNDDLIIPPKPNITGISVGGLFIPSGLDSKALDFLLSLEAQGQLPVEVDPNGLGKQNPFAK